MADTLVLLRGLTRGSGHWGFFLLQLQQRFPGKTVLAVDLAGNGERFAERSPASIAGAVEDIRQQLQRRGFNPPYDVLGLSLGGMIGLQWLQQYPAELDSLVVMNTSHAGLSGMPERLRPRAMATLAGALLMAAACRERIIYSVTSNNPVDDGVVAQWTQLALRQPVSLLNFIRQLRLARSFAQPLSCGGSRVLVLASLGDRMVNSMCSSKIAQQLGAEMRSHPSAGHEISLDNPAWVLGQLTRFYHLS